MTSDFLPDNQSYIRFYQNQQVVNNYYKILCHIVPFMTLPVYAEAFYCILYKCRQFSRRYFLLLQVHLFIHFIGEFYWTVLLLPVIIQPGFSISTEGFLSDFHFSPSWQLFIMCGILQISTAIMIHLLVYRLKFAIPPGASHQKLIKWTANLLNLFFYFTAIFCTCSLGLMDEDQKFAKERLLNKYLLPPPNLWDSNYVTTDRENPNFIYYLYITCGELVIFSVNIITIPTTAFYYLSKNRTDKSEKLAKAHKNTLKTLMMQLAVHCVFHLLPLICFTFSAAFRVKNVMFLSMGMSIWALHGAACTFTLVLGNRPFRTTMVSHLRYVFCCVCCKSTPREQMPKNLSVVQKIDISTQ